MHRIEAVRTMALENTVCYEEFFYHFYKFCFDGDVLSDSELYGETFFFAFSNLTPLISENELVVGKSTQLLSCTMKQEWEEIYFPVAKEVSAKSGDGPGPCQGREMNGPTASVLSATKWPQQELIGGVAVNMKFSKKIIGHTFSRCYERSCENIFKTWWLCNSNQCD